MRIGGTIDSAYVLCLGSVYNYIVAHRRAQSSSAFRFTAGAAGFLTLIQ